MVYHDLSHVYLRLDGFREIFLNPLTVSVGYIRNGNLTYLWFWTPRMVPRSAATHALFCNTVSTDKLCLKTVNFVTVKGLRARIFEGVLIKLITKASRPPVLFLKNFYWNEKQACRMLTINLFLRARQEDAPPRRQRRDAYGT